ncbi:anti-sigma factor antagonist [Streptomyces sp. NPDC101225]|uniref:anti-sigma factor antagonist n=1 Tax=Streptomyces sp. NPDC101225 TaxID=3366135 RepID=UPI0037F36A4C
MTLRVDTAGDRLVVTVSGELDLDSDELLQKTLSDALDRATGGLELDLAGVDFCDCSALRVLLRVHQHARATSKSLVLRASSPPVRRLLALSGALPLFEDGTREPGAAADELATENTQLHRALETRATIDLARGMLMASFRLTPGQAWQVLVTASQRANTKLQVIAEALLRTAHGEALPESLADHVASAVQEHGDPDGRNAGGADPGG